MGTVSLSDVRGLIEKSFPQEVAMFPLMGPDNIKTQHYGLWYGDQCLDTAVKSGYTLHTRDDVSALVEASVKAWGVKEAKVTCSWRDGHCVCVAPTRADRLEVFDNDTIWPRVLIKAGYDGTAFKASVGFYRDACRNLDIPRWEDGFRTKIRHTHSLRPRMDELVKQFEGMGQGWDDLKAWAKRMESNKVQLAEFLKTVYPMPKDATERTQKSYNRRVESVVRRLMSERMSLGRPELGKGIVSGWEAYNAVQGYVQHEKRRKGEPSQFDRALMAVEDKELVIAEKLALAA